MVKDARGALKAGNLYPGQEISVDHFISSVKGRLINSKGKESEEKKYKGDCIFTDHSSGYISTSHFLAVFQVMILYSPRRNSNVCAMMLGLFPRSTLVTTDQPSLHRPLLIIWQTFIKFRDLLVLVHITTMESQ